MQNINAQFISIDQNWQNESITIWFDVTGTSDPERYDGQYGVVVSAFEYTLVDCDGAPLEGAQHWENLLDVIKPQANEQMGAATPDLNNCAGWVAAARALMVGRPNWTALEANGSYLTIVDGGLYFVPAEDAGYVYTVDDLCAVDFTQWDGDAWEGMTADECRAVIEQPKFVTLAYANEYALDIAITASVRVKATSLEEARKMVLAEIDCNTMTLGAWPDGSPILAEGSVHSDDEMPCFEVNGDDAHPDCDA